MKREIKYLFILLLVVISLTSCNNKNNVSDKELVAKYGSNQISTNDLYKKLKEKNGLDTILNEVDKDILNKLYKKNTAEDEYYQKELNTLMVTYQTRYSSTYSTFDEFITKVLGLKNQTEVEEAIRLNYKKRQATQEYLKNTITDKEINDEYQKEKGEIKASHILIAPENSSDAAKKKAKSFAQELIKRIEKGESFEKLAKEYSKDSKEKGGDLGFVNLDSLTKNFREALDKLKIKSEKSKEARIIRNKILSYIKSLELYGTRVGEPIVKHIEDDIWELRPLNNRIFFFYFKDNKFILLHYFVKKTNKTPKKEIEEAKNRMNDFIARSDKNVK